MRGASVVRATLIFCIGVLAGLGGALSAEELDFLNSGASSTPAPVNMTAAFGTCDGIGDGIWNGCRGTGCHVCQERVSAYGCYFQRHTGCILNTTCANQFYSCDAACPPPVEADKCSGTVCDGIGDGYWNGCRGTGCHVCQEKLSGYTCYFQNHPDCVLNTTCANQFYSCDAACPQPTAADICSGCTADFCSSCHRPQSGVDGDGDGVPDQLEYDLAHKFFPTILLQGFDDDLEESYLYHGKAIPFLVQPLGPRSVCDESMECLEIKYGVAYFNDTGDTIFGISSHRGDSEFYAVLVQRTASWSTAQTSPGSWQMIRDFTAAHWRADKGESSRFGAYGYCAPYCHAYDNDEQSCWANSDYCSWFGGFCSGGVGGLTSPVPATTMKGAAISRAEAASGSIQAAHRPLTSRPATGHRHRRPTSRSMPPKASTASTTRNPSAMAAAISAPTPVPTTATTFARTKASSCRTSATARTT